MDAQKIISELQFKAVRSGGAGGQNVNKVASKVVLAFDVPASEGLSEDEKLLIGQKLGNRLNSQNVLVLTADEDRSQLKNKDIATKRLLKLIEKALIVQKKRKPTKVPRAVIEKRIKAKRNQSEIKQSRQKPRL